MTHTHTKSKKPFVSIKDTTMPYVEFVKRFSTEFKARQYLACPRGRQRLDTSRVISQTAP